MDSIERPGSVGTSDRRSSGSAGPRTARRRAADAGLTPLARADLSDARQRLDSTERKAARHLAWALLGLSPAALVPFMALLIEGSITLLAVLLVMVPMVEGWRYRRASREVGRARALVERLHAEHPERS